MCELMAMSALHQTNITLSLTELSRHGGKTDNHEDGWGIAFYQDNDITLFREPGAAAHSHFLKYIKKLEVNSDLVIAHIRQANVGSTQLSNTHPFARELAGRQHVFAHNGQLPEIINHEDFQLGRYRPVGATDSEYAFCVLLHRLETIWTDNGTPPSLEQRLNVVTQFAEALRPYGPANFLYADGEYLFVHGDQRIQADGTRKPPGIYLLCRTCARIEEFPESAGVATKLTGDQHIALVSSVPLTKEGWIPFQRGEILVIKKGEIVLSSHKRDLFQHHHRLYKTPQSEEKSVSL